MPQMPKPADPVNNQEPEIDKPQLVKMAIEMGPVILFGLTYFLYGIIPATGVLMGASIIAVIASKLILGHVGLMPIITAAVALVFGGLTLWFQDSTYIKMKPTIIYLAFSGFLGFGLVTGRNFLARLFGNVFSLTKDGWRLLTIRWAVLFIGLAILNEGVWRNFSEQTWIYFKLFGFTGIILMFSVMQIGLLKRHELESDDQK